MVDVFTPTSDLASNIPDGYFEVVGFKSNEDEFIKFGAFTLELENFGNLKVLSLNPMLSSRWEDAATQKYYPYSYSILWEKRGNELFWHFYMNHAGNSQTGHPAFRAYFETVGKLDGHQVVDMALVKGSEKSLFLQKDVDGTAYNFGDITSRTAKPKHLGQYSKSVQWRQAKEKHGFDTLYEFIEINTDEDRRQIRAQEQSDGEAVPIGFGSIRHLLIGNIHAQLTYVVRQIDQQLFDQSVQPGRSKTD